MSTMSGFFRFRRVLGLAGWMLVYAAVIAMAWEIVVSLKSARYTMISAGEHWYQLHAASLAAFQNFLAVKMPSAVGGPAADLLLSSPAWVVYGGTGLLLLGIAQIGRQSSGRPGRANKATLRDLAWHGHPFG